MVEIAFDIGISVILLVCDIVFLLHTLQECRAAAEEKPIYRQP